MSLSASVTATTSTVTPTATASPSAVPHPVDTKTAMNPILSFLIGFCIILFASVLNAGGLNLTKLDHVRTSALPRASRRREYARPLWLIGMFLYILSQLVGSTLALEYMRAEYVAPLGNSSLVFNFLFANLLVGTPVTKHDIYGTIVIIIGVIGIVAFGSVNSGISNEMSATVLSSLWSRGPWLSYFFLFGCIPILSVYLLGVQLDGILSARSDISAIPFADAAQGFARQQSTRKGYWGKVAATWAKFYAWLGGWLEHWTQSKDDKWLAWTLGLVWACCGGALAGGCLVFAKTIVKLLSGTLGHEYAANQFANVAAIFTMILLAFTAVFQIICLNRALAVYDSTLVVPVFYGVYTASGWLNSLIFYNNVDAYAAWTLFLIFFSIAVLIAGVVLLTNKKPKPAANANGTTDANAAGPNAPMRDRSRGPPSIRSLFGQRAGEEDAEELESLRQRQPGEEEEVVWQVGAASDDEDDDAPVNDAAPRPDDSRQQPQAQQGAAAGGGAPAGQGGLIRPGAGSRTSRPEGRGLLEDEEWEDAAERV